MAQTINTNVASLNAQRNLTSSQGSLATSLQRLSSGLRINSAKDDAAGLAISERFTSQIRGINQAVRNANDGISLAQTAEGALSSMGENLQRIRELAVQSANSTNSSSDRAALNAEVQQLLGEITRVSEQTSFNGLKLLDGSFTTQQFQVGANANQTISVSVSDARTEKLGSDVKASTAGIVSTADLTTGITINGTAIATTGATTMNDVINAVNLKSGETGVTASRADSTVVETGVFTGTNAGSLTINGVDVSFGAGASLTTVIGNINSVAGQSGVTAKADTAGTGITLTSSSGGDVTVKEGAGTNFAAIETTDTKYQAGIQLATKLGGAITVGGTLATTLSVASTVTSFKASALSVGSVSDANTALKTVDFALQQLNSARADLGAVQNRFSSVVANLQTSSENLSASRGRIVDADFAQETANLTRGQILQQAGTAMLAQANGLPQNVLSLLRG